MLRSSLLTLMLLVPLSGHCGAKSDHDRARNAVSSGEVLPLDAILSSVRAHVQGRVLDARLLGDAQKGRWRYRLKILTPEGRMRTLTVNAKTGRVLNSR